MRVLLSIVTLVLAFSAVNGQRVMPSAEPHSEWQEFRSEADGFSIELPGSPKISSEDPGNGATQKMFTLEVGQEHYLVSVIELPHGSGPGNPDEAYFARLMDAYAEGSKTTLRSRLMSTWVGHAAMEGITDAPAAAHLVDLTAVGDRIYLVVYAGAKGQEKSARATHMRDSFKLLGN